jgi:hypothetical protein
MFLTFSLKLMLMYVRPTAKNSKITYQLDIIYLARLSLLTKLELSLQTLTSELLLLSSFVKITTLRADCIKRGLELTAWLTWGIP